MQGRREERKARHYVCSNASAHRMDADVPLLVIEVDAGHTALIDVRRRQRGSEQESG